MYVLLGVGGTVAVQSAWATLPMQLHFALWASARRQPVTHPGALRLQLAKDLRQGLCPSQSPRSHPQPLQLQQLRGLARALKVCPPQLSVGQLRQSLKGLEWGPELAVHWRLKQGWMTQQQQRESQGGLQWQLRGLGWGRLKREVQAMPLRMHGGTCSDCWALTL